MTKEEIFDLMNTNPVFHLATVEDDQPRCRAVFLYRADDNGIIFHTSVKKPLYSQIIKNPKVELCFNDPKNGIQVRVTGKLDLIEDNNFKDEICEHPTRKFLKSFRDSGKMEDFYNDLKVFCLKGGKAFSWSMKTNFMPKEIISL